MATETEKLYNEQTATAASPEAATATPTTQVMTGNQSLDDYNSSRVSQINSMYDSQRDSALGQLEAGHNRTMSDAQAAYDKITPQYQEARNAAGAEYERQRRNNNIQAAASGINTGAGSQMQLAASSVYQENQADLSKAENEALNEASRQMTTLKEQYEADVAKAISDNDAQRAAALLNEYGEQYERMQSEAKQLAAYGDFSMYKQLYGEATANSMQRSWDLQNPQLAYALGRLSADDYFKLTGKYPPGSPEAAAQAASSGSSGRSYGYSGGGSSGGSSGDSAKLTYKEVAQAHAEGYTDDQIKAAAESAGYTGVDTAITRASQSGVAGGKSAAGAASAYKKSSSGSSSTSTPAKQSPTTTSTNKWWGEAT